MPIPDGTTAREINAIFGFSREYETRTQPRVRDYWGVNLN